MSARNDVAGVILAGGQSRRMFASLDPEFAGNRDKGLLALGQKTMVDHVVERLLPQVAYMVINANGDPERFSALGLPVVADPIGGFVGPLAGVLAGLRWAQAHAPGVSRVATVSADAPFLPRDLVARLASVVDRSDTAIAIAQSDGELHPVIGLWPVAHADDLEAALHAGVRKVLAWTDRHGTVPVPFEMIAVGGVHIDPFFNANTPSEMAEARRLMIVMEGE